MTRIGMLHTVAALVPDFDSRARAALSTAQVMHLVDASLLATALETGVHEPLVQRVVDQCRALEALGCEAVLVTCSSIGEAAERANAALSISVLRVDQRMAEEAARLGTAPEATRRVAVMATLSCTLEPSTRLVRRALGDAADVRVEPVLCVGAAEARAAGDMQRHDELVQEHVRGLGKVDAIVLAQASMAGALEGMDAAAPVLTSPDGGVQSLAELFVEA